MYSVQDAYTLYHQQHVKSVLILNSLTGRAFRLIYCQTLINNIWNFQQSDGAYVPSTHNILSCIQDIPRISAAMIISDIINPKLIKIFNFKISKSPCCYCWNKILKFNNWLLLSGTSHRLKTFLNSICYTNMYQVVFNRSRSLYKRGNWI